MDVEDAVLADPVARGAIEAARTGSPDELRTRPRTRRGPGDGDGSQDDDGSDGPRLRLV